MSTTTPRPNPPATKPLPWYRVPFVWFVIVLLLATLAAAAHLIVISLDGYEPSTLEPQHERLFKVPAAPEPAKNKRDPQVPT